MYKKDNDDFNFVCDDCCEPAPADLFEHTPKDETVYFEDLDKPVQEIIIDLLASIIKNS